MIRDYVIVYRPSAVQSSQGSERYLFLQAYSADEAIIRFDLLIGWPEGRPANPETRRGWGESQSGALLVDVQPFQEGNFEHENAKYATVHRSK